MADSTTSKSVPRPQLLDWCAAVTFVALLIANGFIGSGSNRVLRTLGATLLLLSPFLFVPPFFLLKKYGSADEGGSFFDTNATVDRGVYAVVRHPQYLGYMLMVLGFALLSQHVLTATIGAAAILFFYLHTVKEDQFCRENLGEGYREYAGRVPRFNLVLGTIRYFRRKRLE